MKVGCRSNRGVGRVWPAIRPGRWMHFEDRGDCPDKWVHSKDHGDCQACAIQGSACCSHEDAGDQSATFPGRAL